MAEEEVDELSTYFVETEQWNRVWKDEVDVVYGPKGSGKSAIYSTLISREAQLFDRSILIRAAENPRGTPAFASLIEDPPMAENEFVGLWKLYFLALIADTFEEYEISSSQARRVIRILSEAQLRPSGKTLLRQHVKNALDYVRRLLRPKEIEPTISFDASGTITAVSTRIQFSEPDAAERAHGKIYVNELLDDAGEALAEAGVDLWLLLDRLDVAFAANPELEQNALRALFKVYLDIAHIEQIKLKIFLRTDIWKSITSSGFREASHITRELTLNWSRAALLQLVSQRLVKNPSLIAYCKTNTTGVLATAQAQQALFDQIYPEQVEGGPNKPRTFDWCMTRTRDGMGATAPRELIHLLSEARNIQLRRMEIGESELAGEKLFERSSLKEALPAVSETRLTKTLYAEYPSMRDYIQRMEGQKTNHNAYSLCVIWEVAEESAKAIALSLVDIGFFERRGQLSAPQFWVPFLYRPALQLVQGTAEGVAVSEQQADFEED